MASGHLNPRPLHRPLALALGKGRFLMNVAAIWRYPVKSM
jgi:hypothetical protein